MARSNDEGVFFPEHLETWKDWEIEMIFGPKVAELFRIRTKRATPPNGVTPEEPK